MVRARPGQDLEKKALGTFVLLEQALGLVLGQTGVVLRQEKLGWVLG